LIIIKQHKCYGCPFITVATEYPATANAGHQVALEHKRSALKRFKQLSEEASAQKPDAMAHALFLLMDGAYVSARMFGVSPGNPSVHLVEAARQIIKAYL